MLFDIIIAIAKYIASNKVIEFLVSPINFIAEPKEEQGDYTC